MHASEVSGQSAAAGAGVPPPFSLTGKTVVVTGGARGIGRGIAEAMARCGANLVITARGGPALAAAVADLQRLGPAVLGVQADITSADDLARTVAAATERFGTLHGWINNAGSADPGDVGPLIDVREDQWDRVLDLNLKWTFFAAQAAARAMRAGGAGGAIVNISSRSASYPNPGTGHYGAAKAGIENLTRTMAVEWGQHGIRVNAVAPGVVLTEALAETLNTPARLRRQAEVVPLQRIGRPDDIGPACAWLVSDGAAWTSGAVIPVNGGSIVPLGYLSWLHHANRGLAEAAR